MPKLSSKRKKVVKDDTPDTLKPYRFHGLFVDDHDGKNCTTECPFCDKKKFVIKVDTGQARCLVCGVSETGSGLNASSFVRKLHEFYLQKTEQMPQVYFDRLVENRGLMSDKVLRDYKIVWNGKEWLIPGYNDSGKMTQLYRYILIDGKKRVCLPTPTLGISMYGRNRFNSKSKKPVYIVEGFWDLAAVAELREGKFDIIGIPGVNVFHDRWARLFKGRSVALLFDNDHPKQHDNGTTTNKGGVIGLNYVGSKLKHSSTPPSEINYLRWGSDDAGFAYEVKDGTDVRDVLTGEVTIKGK